MVGTIDGEVVVEHQPFSRTVAGDAVAEGDGAREHDGVARRVGGGVDEVVDGHVVGGIAHRVGDVGFTVGVVGRVGDGLLGTC